MKKFLILLIVIITIGCSTEGNNFKALECTFSDIRGTAYLVINDKEKTFDAYAIDSNEPESSGPSNILYSGTVYETATTLTLNTDLGGQLFVDRTTLIVTATGSDSILYCDVIDVPKDYLDFINGEVRF
tara:strand:+ start:1194 stop:1580 length:387 start_codon:yes stop_codon:yes gene_type:complete